MESSVATPDSIGEDSNPTNVAKAAAMKDRQCQYCHQPFTSSSLGRHLDQYLSKKKPDGIHDVDEIRRLRGGITRRQARTTSGKQEAGSDDASVSKPSPALRPRSPSLTASTINTVPAEGFRMMFNAPNWQSTGVINGIPGSPLVTVTPGQGPISAKRPTVRIEPGKLVDSEERDNSRALELALREVLDNVRAARLVPAVPSLYAMNALKLTSFSDSVRTRPLPSPFDFDLQSQTYPALCLLTLPPPPSLISIQPFPAPGSFPLDPPGPQHLDLIRQKLHMQIEAWKTDQLSSASKRPRGGHQIIHANDPDMITRTARQHEEIAIKHLELACKHWLALPPKTQHEKWHLEILRAYARESEKRTTIEDQLARVQQEANLLRAQVEKLSCLQYPREFALFPPESIPIAKDIARDLSNKTDGGATGAEKWDFDRIVGKWKKAVQEDRKNHRVTTGSLSAAVQALPDSSLQQYQNRIASSPLPKNISRLTNGNGKHKLPDDIMDGEGPNWTCVSGREPNNKRANKRVKASASSNQTPTAAHGDGLNGVAVAGDGGGFGAAQGLVLEITPDQFGEEDGEGEADAD